MANINEKNKIYVLCPPKIKTGGTELLHQLVYKLNGIGKESFLVYTTKNKTEECTPNDFKKYINNYKYIDEIEDEKENTIVVPETYIEYIKNIKNAQKMVWWLSVDNYIKRYSVFYNIKNGFYRIAFNNIFSGRIFLKNIFKKYDYHLCQSHYAINFLKKYKIENNVMYLSDYINKTYLTLKFNIDNKENIVLYNPKKGIKYTNRIRKLFNEDIKWLPIENMTTEQVKETLLKSKVYIDFGHHPGKDRFPREAAMCGCCVITGKKGSAAFWDDVPIETKFDDKTDLNVIREKIEDCIYNYEKNIHNYDKYREMILNEEKKFEEDIIKIFRG